MEHKDIAFEIKVEEIKTDGTFSGYGSTFGGEPDAYGDVVIQGAFLESLKKGGRNGTGVAMLWQHKSDMVPGKWLSIQEDSKGLAVEGQYILETQLGKEAYILTKEKAIQGLSIGYDTIVSEYDREKDIRFLKQLNLWEISPVTFPANISATITGVKMFEEAQTLREFDVALREVGLTRKQAQYIASLCKDKFESLRESEEEIKNTEWQKALELINSYRIMEACK